MILMDVQPIGVYHIPMKTQCDEAEGAALTRDPLRRELNACRQRLAQSDELFEVYKKSEALLHGESGLGLDGGNPVVPDRLADLVDFFRAGIRGDDFGIRIVTFPKSVAGIVGHYPVTGRKAAATWRGSEFSQIHGGG